MLVMGLPAIRFPSLVRIAMLSWSEKGYLLEAGVSGVMSTSPPTTIFYEDLPFWKLSCL